jgi:hypothetical protein
MATNVNPRRKLALVVDPRFPGGTSTAVAHEIRALDGHADLRVFALETAMFHGRRVNAALQEALDACGLELVWNPPVIRSEVVFFHNPSFLRFDDRLALRVSCGLALLIAHENFLRPNGSESFDVEKCLRLIDGALVCRARFIAPISPHNRRTVETWTRRTGCDWPVTDFDCVPVVDLEMTPPTDMPRDRRGRHSRPGFEKFPSLEAMLACFPPSAESCVILGGDNFLPGADATEHWTIFRFGELPVADFFDRIDFHVYFTNPLWREGFGRVIAEAIAAGKVVITDPGTAEAFGEAVVGCELHEIDDVIAGFIREPGRYRDFVLKAQAALKRFGPEAFRAHLLANLDRCRDAANALL